MRIEQRDVRLRDEPQQFGIAGGLDGWGGEGEGGRTGQEVTAFQSAALLLQSQATL